MPPQEIKPAGGFAFAVRHATHMLKLMPNMLFQSILFGDPLTVSAFFITKVWLLTFSVLLLSLSSLAPLKGVRE